MITSAAVRNLSKGNVLKASALWAVLGLGVLIPGLSVSAAERTPNEGGSAVGQSVVADASPWAWVSDRAGVVKAIDLADGSTRWHGPSRGLPLALQNGELLVMTAPSGAGKLTLSVVNPQSGDVDRGFSIDLPASVIASPMPLPAQRFQIWAAVVGDDIAINWEYQSAPLRGTELGHDGTASRVESQEGALVLNLEDDSSRVVAVDNALRRFDLGAESRLAQIEGTQFRSSDSQHVMTAAAVEDRVFGWQWKWQLHDRASGASVGSITVPVSTAPYVIHEDRVLWQSGPVTAPDAKGKMYSHGSRLIAQNIADGSVRWTVDIADREYQGTLPP